MSIFRQWTAEEKELKIKIAGLKASLKSREDCGLTNHLLARQLAEAKESLKFLRKSERNK